MRWLGLLLALVAPVALGQGRSREVRLGPDFPLWPEATSSVVRAPSLKSWVTGWALTGSNPSAYEVRCEDPVSKCSVPVLRTRLGAEEPLGNASLTHTESAAPWRGRRVVLRAELRPGRIDGWAALWMRVDAADGTPLAFDNMQNRPLRGTTAYGWYRVVLDVPPEAEHVTFGVMLRGPGAVFIGELQFELAPASEASTDLIAPLRAQARAQTETPAPGGRP
jgi:hypothetical protein